MAIARICNTSIHIYTRERRKVYAKRLGNIVPDFELCYTAAYLLQR